jgi:hypothetical protein
MSRYARDNVSNAWRNLPPETRLIVTKNLHEIREYWETPNVEKRKPSEEGQGESEEKSNSQKGH